MIRLGRPRALRWLCAVMALTALAACQRDAEPVLAAPPAATPPAATEPAPSWRQPAPQRPSPESTFSVLGVAPGDVVHLRVAPAASSASRVWIPPGTTNVRDLDAFMPDAEDEQTIWRRVGYAGLEGWVDARFLKSNQPPKSGPELATGTKLGALVRLTCFGNSGRSWSLKFGADGGATCEGACAGPAGLRAANVSVSYDGDVRAFDLIDPRDAVFLHAATRATGNCRSGKSNEADYYEIKAEAERGALTGCCRHPFASAHPAGLGHQRRRD